MSQRLLGYEIEDESVSECNLNIVSSINNAQKASKWMACINPHSYVVAKSDPLFSEALKHADWLVPDGVGIVLASKFLRRPVTERITGFDVFHGIMRHLDKTNGRVFFLGSTEKTLGMISGQLVKDYPNVELVGLYSPPFKSEFDKTDIDLMISKIVDANPDVLWVGLTAPKQEKWIYQNIDRLPVTFVGAVGAVFDFYTGQVKRSSPIFRKLGLEWLPRLIKQPRRLWRRMGISAPIFVWDVILERFSYAKR
ncbi:WecB/TagA/CpsF family glycosyltransferase [Loktanella sp. R86503]|uniref:WecB/TagA/CpsF family glycosyltransferase n=1 Tax=Loktanella sp. R86503 TaxID=3093847 RepID=UPI0036DB015C